MSALPPLRRDRHAAHPAEECPAPAPSRIAPSRTARLAVPGLKISVPLQADQLPRDLVPPEPAPVGEPVLELALEGGFTARAKINGKNYRKLLKQVAEHGAANVVVVLQGTLKAPAAPGGPFVLEGAGFQVNVKAPRTPTPEAPAAPPPADTAPSE